LDIRSWVLGLGVLFSCVSFASAEEVSGAFPNLNVLSAVPYPVTHLILGLIFVIIIVVILIGLTFIDVLRKNLKRIAVVTLVAIAVIAGFYAVWSSEPPINYWFVAPSTTATEDNNLTIYCENTGPLVGTFDLELAFANPHFSQKTSLPYQFIDSRTVRFTPYIAGPGERKSKQ
jgi:hypothetical protein